MSRKISPTKGRLNKRPYWVIVLKCFLKFLIITAVMYVCVKIFKGKETSFLLYPIFAIGTAYLSTSFIAIFQGTIRRLHDRNKSAWWLILFFVTPPILRRVALDISDQEPGLSGTGTVLSLLGLAILLWAAVELGFLTGTSGSNRFGLDPIASE